MVSTILDIQVGNYFEFGEGDTYIRMVIIGPDTCRVTDGVGLGETMEIKEWIFINEWGTGEKIRRATSPRIKGILRTNSLPMPDRSEIRNNRNRVTYNTTVCMRTYSCQDRPFIESKTRLQCCSSTLAFSKVIEPRVEADARIPVTSCCMLT